MKDVMIEFFSGRGILADTFKERGYVTLKVDNDSKRNPDLVADVLNFQISDIYVWYRKPKVVHFGVPCTKFSVAGRNSNFTDFMPNSKDAAIALALVYKCFELIKELKPEYWFIENPMGYLRKFPFMQKQIRKEVWYCQYGDTKAKPTDFFTNRAEWIPKKCYNNNPNCHHERAPRGSKTGTQGLSTSYERGIYPKKLCEELVDVCENNLKIKQNTL